MKANSNAKRHVSVKTRSKSEQANMSTGRGKTQTSTNNEEVWDIVRQFVTLGTDKGEAHD